MKLIKLFESDVDLFASKAYESDSLRTRNFNVKIKFLKKKIGSLSENNNDVRTGVMEILQKKYNITSNGIFGESIPGWATPEVQQYMKYFKQYMARKDKVNTAILDLQNQLLKLKHPDEFNMIIDSRAKNVERGWSSTIPNPPKIVIAAMSTAGIDNPYWHPRAYPAFTGRPWDYPSWTPQRLKEYVCYNTMLKRAGLQEFTKMYSGMYDGKYRNFLMVGANDDVAWRVYDVGAGSGQNKIFIKGRTYYATDFDFNDSTAQIDAIFAKAWKGVP